ncbi:hypothetical protein ABT340_39670 [Streptosporangium sp. NPDC000239]|uniref:hypothetical protein n=1 Tax=Streptosporangium sp. NPDC000239 TaxID=3154248 RepID=UPI00333209B7
MTYAQWLQSKGVGSMRRTYATKPQVLVDTAVQRTVRDENGHDVTDRTSPDGREHRDVTINLRP